MGHRLAAPPPPAGGHARPRAASGSASAGTATARAPASELAYEDRFDDYLGFLAPKLARARELLLREGTLYVHLDYREAHYVKVALDAIFGRDCFLNEIIWAYDYGAKPARRWPAKHDTILVYVRDRERYLFDAEAVDREPYMAPGLVGSGEGGARQAPDRHLVAHDRRDVGRRAHRLSDAEARGRRCGGSSPRRRARAAGAWTSSPARARSAPSARRSAAATC